MTNEMMNVKNFNVKSKISLQNLGMMIFWIGNAPSFIPL